MNEGTAPADLMTCSAMPSSSSVLTPGATAAATASSASATTRPAARMSRICSALLSSIRSLTVVRVPSAARRRQGRREAPRDPVDVAHAVDLHEEAALPVDVHERGRLLDVHVLAVPDDIFGVVGPALELGPALQALDDLVLVDGELDDGVEPRVVRGQHRVERADLRDVAGVAVEHEACAAVRLRDAVLDHVVRDLVGHELAGVQVALGQQAQLARLGDVRPEDVARRDGGNTEVRGEPLGLGALAGTRRAEEHQ